ncbi:MAG TPA: ABC transporter ATP-binding protein [Candidatus Paceibacterota bacterium]|nr:ABC transporter ATP-binding protein [Candidatus Paceibacterota bacterium]
MKTGKFLGRMYEAYRPFRGALLLTSGLLIASQALGLATPFFYGRIVKGMINHWPIELEIGFAFAVFGVVFGQSLLNTIFHIVHILMIAYDAEDKTSDDTLRSISRLSIGQIANQNSGFKVDVIKKGESAMADFTQLFLMELMPMCVRVTLTLGGLFWLDWRIGLVMVASILAYFTVSNYIVGKFFPLVKAHHREESRLGTAYFEAIKNLRLVALSGQEERMIREYADDYRRFANTGKKLWTTYNIKVNFFREPFLAIGQLAMLLMAIWLVYQGIVGADKLVTAMGWSMAVLASIGNIGSMQRRYLRNKALILRYFRLLDMPPAITVVDNPIRPEKFDGRIELKNVSFSYPTFEDPDDETGKESENDSPSAVHGISLVIPQGQVTAFVGHSGSGKSTVVNLILRGFDPDEGAVFIDGNDLRQLDLKQWRQAVGVVDQSPQLWDRTLRYNMAYGLNGHADYATDDMLNDLAEKTRISEFYHRLGSKRFDTLIGENGIQLSGGQRQRVAIARAIAKSPSVLILDEATNALDPENEHLVHEAIRTAMEGRTGIIIAHRLSTIRHADQIVVFEKGRIQGVGKHAELMRSCIQYRNLVSRETGMAMV